MAILNTLFQLYEDEGFTVSSGLNPCHFDECEVVTFTGLFKDGECYTEGLGISSKEVYFLECLFDGYRPERAFIIGNSFGWSTLAIGLLNPKATVVAMDAGFDANSLEGIEMTNRLVAKSGLNTRAVKGVSPEDVDRVVGDCFDGPIDFCFVDGLHTNEQVLIDYRALEPHLADDAVLLFHDTVTWNLESGIANIAREFGGPPDVLYGTCSGMALFHAGGHPHVKRVAATFRGSPDAGRTLVRMFKPPKHRHLNRWRRSIDKRVARLKGLSSGR